VADYAFDNLPEDDVVLDLLVDAVIFHGVYSTDRLLSSTMHPKLLARVGNKMFVSQRAAAPKELDAKDYQLKETKD